MFDPRSPYHRRRWHYESDRPLSVPQLISLGSLDARTAALLWLLIEHHQSVIVSGPTDPTPGVGKTTTLNALLGFLPNGSTLVYTTGMYEDFDFTSQVQPETTCVLANEVSDHLPIYMWGRVARRLLHLPADGFAVATSCHADEVGDVLAMLARDLKLPPSDICRLGIIVNIGLVGRIWPPRRRFLTANFIRPTLPEAPPDSDGAKATRSGARPKDTAREQWFGVSLLPLATWDPASDTFAPAAPQTLTVLAGIVGMTPEAFCDALERRTALMASLADGHGVGVRAMREAMEDFLAEE